MRHVTQYSFWKQPSPSCIVAGAPKSASHYENLKYYQSTSKPRLKVQQDLVVHQGVPGRSEESAPVGSNGCQSTILVSGAAGRCEDRPATWLPS